MLQGVPSDSRNNEQTMSTRKLRIKSKRRGAKMIERDNLLPVLTNAACRGYGARFSRVLNTYTRVFSS